MIYARVSSNEQKQKGVLDSQAMFLMENVKDLHNLVILKEVGSGLADKRKKIQKLIGMVLDGKVSRVFVTYRDRLTRFGFYYLETMFSHEGVEIVVVKDKEHEKSVNEEQAGDKLEAIERLIDETKSDSVSKKALLAIIDKEEDPLGMAQ